MNSEDVLNRLLSRQIEKVVMPPRPRKRPGRPTVEKEKKARNFTLCLAPEFVSFIDRMKVKDPKVKGRGRKIRFIIERFIEHERRSLTHIKVLKQSLAHVQEILGGFSKQIKKGEKLSLGLKDKQRISAAVNEAHTVMRILGYAPKTLKKMLPPEDWALLSFCLDWKNNREIVF